MANDRTGPELPPLAGLRPHFAVTVLERRDPDAQGAFATLHGFLHAALSEPGRAHAVRIAAERLIVDPGDDVGGLGRLAGFGFDGIYLAVRQRWQRSRWAGPGADLIDLVHELTVAVARDRLVAVQTAVSDQVLRGWTREQAAPYRFLPRTIVDAVVAGDRPPLGASVAPAVSRFSVAGHTGFADYLAAVSELFDALDKALVAVPDNPFE